MKIKDLKEQLNEFDENLDVRIQVSYDINKSVGYVESSDIEEVDAYGDYVVISGNCTDSDSVS